MCGREEKEYMRELCDVLPNSKVVSTIWLSPSNYETMVFSPDRDYEDIDAERSTTERNAIAAHLRMMEKWSVT